MKKAAIAGLVSLLSLTLTAGAQDKARQKKSASAPAPAPAREIQVKVDLLNVKNDRVKVTVIPPPISEKQLTFVMPRTVPGTYDDYNFGRFIIDVAAYDAQGRFLSTARLGKNEIVITNAQKLARFEYHVNDTWDDDDSTKFVFQPAGTNIEAGSHYMINPQGFFGYFEGYANLPYVITYTKPSALYGATPLQKKTVNDTTDIVTADNYAHLIDSPTMYSKPDTASFMAGTTKIDVSIVSPSKAINAAQVRETLRPLVAATEKFFVKLPVDHYSFLMYFADLNNPELLKGRGFGAHEHSYSSVYFLPEYKNPKMVDDIIRQSAIHEFLHIMIPLNLHSEEVEYFDFKDPKMSQHLWLYEGTTEYFSLLAQVQGGLISEEKFRQELRQRILSIQNLGDLISLTEMSKKVFEPQMQEIYPSIYMRGAVVAMMLDLRLRELSRGSMSLLDLVRKLTAMYGPHKPFRDEELFSVIEKISYPEIGDFFRKYIIGTEQIPYNEFLDAIGWKFYPEKQSMGYSFGSHQLYGTPQGIMIMPAEGGESRFGVQRGDRLIAVEGQEIPMDETAQELIRKVFAPADSSRLTITVERKGEKVDLSASPVYTQKTLKNVIENDPAASPEAVTIRKQLLEGKAS